MKQLIFSGLMISLTIFLGRIAGFTREILIAAKFGVSNFSDFAVFLFVIPEFIIGFLVSGAVGAVLVPVMKRLDNKNAHALYLQVKLMMFFIFFLLSLSINLYPELFIKMLAPGFSQEKINSLKSFVQISIWILPISAITAVTSAYLQYLEKFVITASSTLIFNLILIFSIYFLFKANPLNNLYILSYSILFAGFIRFLPQYFLIKKYAKYNLKNPTWLLKYDLIKRYFQAMSSVSLLIILPIIGGAFSSFLPNGGLTNFNYANKLIQFPIGILLSAFSIILLPKLSGMLALNKQEEIKSLFNMSLQIILILTFAVVLIFELYTPLIVKTIYGRGNINNDSLELLITLTRVGILSLPAIGASNLFVSFFNSNMNTKSPFYINCFVLFYMLTSSIGLLSIYSSKILMLNIVICYWLLTLLQSFYLIKKYQINFKNILYVSDIMLITLSAISISLLFNFSKQLEYSYIVSLAQMLIHGILLLVFISLSIKNIRELFINKVKLVK